MNINIQEGTSSKNKNIQLLQEPNTTTNKKRTKLKLQRQHKHSVQTNQPSTEMKYSCVATHVQNMSKMGQTKIRLGGKATEPSTTDLTNNNSEQFGTRKKLPLLVIYIYIQKQRPHKMVAGLLPSIVQRIDAAKSPAYTPQSAKHEDRGHMGHREIKQNNEINE